MIQEKNTRPSATISPFLANHLIGKAGLEQAKYIQIPTETACFTSMIAASHVVGSVYSVCYPGGRALPIPLYGIAEQPSGTGKTWLVTDFYDGYIETANMLNREIDKERKTMQDSIKLSTRNGKEPNENEIEMMEALRNIPTGTTDATPQSLEKVMLRNNGFFMIYGTEQNLTKTLLGGMYSDGAVVDGIINSAFNGEHSSTERASDTRVTFHGQPFGGIFCLSQEGTIQTILDSAGSSGLTERFLAHREDDLLGERDKFASVDNDELLDFIYSSGPAPKAILEKSKVVQQRPAFDAYRKKMSSLAMERKELGSADLKGLKKLEFSVEGWAVIEAVKSLFERDIKKQAVRNSFLASMNSKIDIQVMKLAATIHVMDTASHQSVGEIGVDSVRTAFFVISEIFKGMASISTENNMFGDNPEEQAIYDYLQQQRKPVSFDKIYMSLYRAKNSPFKFYQKRGEAKKMIDKAMQRLSEQGRLYQTGGKTPLYSVN